MKHIVILFDKYPVKFRHVGTRRVGTCVAERQATRFDSELAARQAAADQGFQLPAVTIKSVNK